MRTYPRIIKLLTLVQQREQEGKCVTIGIIGSALPAFIRTFLSHAKFRFVLLINGSDCTFPFSTFKTKQEFDNFINDTRIVKVFVQNCAIKHPKIQQVPIGLDFHTLGRTATDWGPQQHPKLQEQTLKSLVLRGKNKPFWERRLIAYANFHFFFGTGHGQDRRDAIQQIPSTAIYYEKTKVPRVQSWTKQLDYAFVVSPHGNGLDCHRTWEALNLGCIPIVKRSPLDTLYEKLPVLIVSQWSEVTQCRLASCVADFKHREFDFDVLSLSYWKTQLEDAVCIKNY